MFFWGRRLVGQTGWALSRGRNTICSQLAVMFLSDTENAVEHWSWMTLGTKGIYPLVPNFHLPPGTSKAWCAQVTGHKIQELSVLRVGWIWERNKASLEKAMTQGIFMFIRVSTFPQRLVSTIRNEFICSGHYEPSQRGPSEQTISNH